MMIKLIALDLDNTTLNSESRLSAGNRAALEAAIARGVNVVIATGRPYVALPADVLSVTGIQYALTSNGANIFDLRTGTSIYRNCISAASIEKGMEILIRYPYMLEVFVDGRAYVEKSEYEKIRQHGCSYRSAQYVLTTRKPMADLPGFTLAHKDAVENININFEDLSEKPAMRQVLLTIPNITLTSSFDHNLEIGGATTSKADAIRHLCGILGVTSEEVMAAGDSPNDIAMLSCAGVSVAVANAKPEVKAAASYIAPANYEDGVADAIRKFVLI